MPQSFHNQTVPGQEEHNAVLLFMWAGLIAAGIVVGVLMSYFGIRRSQILEIYLLACIVLLHRHGFNQDQPEAQGCS